MNSFVGNSTFEEKKHQQDSSKNDNQVGKSVVLDNDKSVSVASSVATTTATTVSNNQVDSCISILDNDKEAVINKKKKYKKKNKKQKNPENLRIDIVIQTRFITQNTDRTLFLEK